MYEADSHSWKKDLAYQKENKYKQNYSRISRIQKKGHQNVL